MRKTISLSWFYCLSIQYLSVYLLFLFILDWVWDIKSVNLSFFKFKSQFYLSISLLFFVYKQAEEKCTNFTKLFSVINVSSWLYFLFVFWPFCLLLNELFSILRLSIFSLLSLLSSFLFCTQWRILMKMFLRSLTLKKNHPELEESSWRRKHKSTQKEKEREKRLFYFQFNDNYDDEMIFLKIFHHQKYCILPFNSTLIIFDNIDFNIFIKYLRKIFN